MSGPDDGRSFARMLRVSALVLLLEAAAALVVGMVLGDTRQPGPDEEYMSALTFLALPFLGVLVLVAAVVVSLAFVLPTVWLGEGLGRRVGGRPGGWQLLLAGVAATLLVAYEGIWPWWPAVWGAMTAAALITRHARRGSFVTVLVWGTLAVLTVFMLGGIGVYTGLIEA
ncbi:hypothetical protein ACF07V_03620 [Streptomyces sp. NPDC015661]|uniref:hypothetical protein n=1 Tax=Streptomyces sp. NPDC015661 TaxID=3364961 RepID=UPI0036FA928A